MIDALFCDPGEYLTPESIVAEYFSLMDESMLLLGCPRCHSLNTRLVEIEHRRMTICRDCGDLCPAPPVN